MPKLAEAQSPQNVQALPDIMAKDLNVIFCGINPGQSSAAAGHHFLNKSTRFWRTLHLAGFTPDLLSGENDRCLLKYGCGLTTAVGRPTKRANELSKRELTESAGALEQKLEQWSPYCIAFLGKAAYSALVREKNVQWGRQPLKMCGSVAWVLPNPSGLNRAFRLEDLVIAYRELRTFIEKRN
jgi:TDG/mug DNA glycosylase family protein